MKKLTPKKTITDKTVAPSATVKLERVMIIAGIVLVFSLTALSLYLWQPTWLFPVEETVPTPPIATTTAPVVEDVCLDCVSDPISGELLPEDQTLGRPWAIMIDNYLGARPTVGINQAAIVYEAPVEGGVTRLLAVFRAQNLPNEVGPVRSARPYFVNWAKDLGASYVHVGGSPEALDLAKSLGSQDINEFYKGVYFWRANDRQAPHNVLTSKEKLETYRKELGETEGSFSLLKETYFKPYEFKENIINETRLASTVAVKYSAGYNISWHYEPKNNTYQRFLETGPHTEADGSLIKVDNLIFPLRTFKVVDKDLRLEIIPQKSGTALLCQDGACEWGTWKQGSSSERWRFYKKDGTEFVFNIGKTWISLISRLEDVQY